ncbi:DUF1289 domain-containing protein [Vibrio sp. LaRot3]|uniref:DUF1289 domain-containing protein n=1 Tax=Vibrio sp. LaRot3 TaxID=2998829 RepID=UPI0022CE2D42|nr:DUF1289 domain-containing protein [Vibrio sp. LaRot3]MDA0148458.1 DUF1289 domain-containing protein [Vibrio sp. LaRot3]
MKTPCIGACKNNGGICSGCHRTVGEITQWRHLDDAEHQAIMDKLARKETTHACPTCNSNAYCDISAGKSTCWCFELEKRDRSGIEETGVCMCRTCLSALPIE